METPATTSSAEEQAVIAINGTIEDAASKEELLRNLEGEQKNAEGAKKERINDYIQGIRPQIEDVMVDDLEEGVGGEFDGEKKTIAKESLAVHASIQETIDMTTEIVEHETYHEENDHTKPMQSGSSAKGETVVTLGTEKFKDRDFIEGITVLRTGDRFVSNEYRGFRRKMERALRNSDTTIEQVEHAVKQKDLRLIDDVDQGRSFAQSI